MIYIPPSTQHPHLAKPPVAMAHASGRRNVLNTAKTPLDDKAQGQRWFKHRLQVVLTPPYPDEPTHPMNSLAVDWLNEAVTAWKAASKESLMFSVLSHPAPQADIVLQWREDPHPEKPYEAGRTLFECDGEQQGMNSLSHVTIELLRKPKINQHLAVHQQYIQYYATLLHELGHALGLEHASHPASVMYHRSLQNRQITPEDAAMLQRLYGLA
jgi:predicted Zn-dependent protease